MKTLKIIAWTLFGIVLMGCGNLTKGKEAAEQAIAHVHQLYNEGKLDQIWTEAGPAFRSATTQQKYDELMTAIQRKLGKVTSTTNAGWNIQNSNFKTTVAMTQQTVFEKGQGTELFTFGMNGTNAVLVGYNIQSADLITK